MAHTVVCTAKIGIVLCPEIHVGWILCQIESQVMSSISRSMYTFEVESIVNNA